MRELLPPAQIAQSLANKQKLLLCVCHKSVALRVTKKVEQQICIKFCQKLVHSCSEMGCAQDKKCFRQFKEGQISVERVMNVQGGLLQAGTN
jgi:hypothetical protein